MPPKKDGVCDICGGQLYQRADDKQETIKKRLAVYRQEVSSLLKYYEQNDLLKNLSADGDANIVLNKIIELAKQNNDSIKV
jgi:adenylate kinase